MILYRDEKNTETVTQGQGEQNTYSNDFEKTSSQRTHYNDGYNRFTLQKLVF